MLYSPGFYIFLRKKKKKISLYICLGLKNMCLPRKAHTSHGMENVTLFPTNYYNFEITRLSDKDTGKGIPVLY